MFSIEQSFATNHFRLIAFHGLLFSCDRFVIASPVQVYLATRSGSWVMNRVWDGGEPADLAYLSRLVPDVLYEGNEKKKRTKYLPTGPHNSSRIRFRRALLLIILVFPPVLWCP